MNQLNSMIRRAFAAAVLIALSGCGGGGSESGSAPVLMAVTYDASWTPPEKPPTVAEDSAKKHKVLNDAGIPSTIDQCVIVAWDSSPPPGETEGASITGDLSTYMLYRIPQDYVESAKKLGFTEVTISGGNLVGVGRTINPTFFGCTAK